MLLYRIKATLKNPVAKELASRRVSDAKESVISKMTDYNRINEGKTIFIVSECSGDSMILGASVSATQVTSINLLAASFLSEMGFESLKLICTEITVNEFAHLVHKADEYGFVRDEDAFLEEISLGSFRTCTSDRSSEWLSNRKVDKQLLYDYVKDFNCGKDLFAELDRIYEYPVCETAGHPVHYVIVADDKTLIHDMIQVLTSALIAVGRLKGQRVSEVLPKRPDSNAFLSLDLDDDRPYLSIQTLKRLYTISSGATIVIQPGLQESESDVTVPSVTSLEDVRDLVFQNRKDVLSILVFSKTDTKGLARFRELARGLRFIEIREQLIFRERAIEILKSKAKTDGIADVTSLVSRIPQGEISYYIADLNCLYDNWLTDQHTLESYPQYKGIVTYNECSPSSIGEAYAKLQNLIGLGNVKKVINQALDFAQFQTVFPQSCPKDFIPSKHMVFAGNPGTAKTTVARLYAQIMKDNGVLPEGRLIEVGRQDLVGKYVGWTAKNVAEAFDRARGSVLFIDEAYSLCDDRTGSYGDEAINTIVQFMENRKDNTVVIFAGYPDKMQGFLDRNPGLRSRIAYHINFKDYSIDELLQILELQAKENSLRLDPEAVSKAKNIIGQALSRKDFGNGRFVRNLMESARVNQVSRIMAAYRSGTLNNQPTDLLQACDFCMPEELQLAMQVKRTIGFVQ